MSKKQSQKTTPDAENQAEKFKRLAREIGADEDEAAFKERLKRLGKAKPKKDEPTDK